MAILALLCLMTISSALQTEAESSIIGSSSSSFKCSSCCTNGAPGLPGPQGKTREKGAQGEPPAIHKSAFSVVNTESKTVKVGDILSGWSEVITNEGDDFNPVTGIFTCRVPGTYSFTFSCMKWGSSDGPVCHLSSNKKDVIVGVYVGYKDQYHHVTNGAILNLARGDQVYVKIGHKPGNVESNGWKFVSFSGFTLFQQ